MGLSFLANGAVIISRAGIVRWIQIEHMHDDLGPLNMLQKLMTHPNVDVRTFYKTWQIRHAYLHVHVA